MYKKGLLIVPYPARVRHSLLGNLHEESEVRLSDFKLIYKLSHI